MKPQPQTGPREYPGGKLRGKVAVITGGDSGIGRSVAVLFAQEGADIAIGYLTQQGDAEKTRELIEQYGRKCLVFQGDVGEQQTCHTLVETVIRSFGKLDIVVNNAAEQFPQQDFLNISPEQLERTFRTNIFAYFFLTQAALPHLRPGSVIINTASVTAYRGSPHLVDYSATKGAIVTFTRSLAQGLSAQGIRVNAVAPGPIWTPLIAASFSPAEQRTFGQDVALGRAGQPEEVAPSFLFLACDDSSYMTGQVLHPNGGEMVES